MNIHSNIMSLPKVSIITPSYNQDKFIEETILSIINQNYPNLEYIIIDGGSTDNSVEIIKKYEKYLAYWISEKDSGQSEAINKGFERATGDIVCWLNSDDILMPNALKKIKEYFEKHKDVDFVSGDLVKINENSIIYSCFFTLKQKKWYAKHGIYYVDQPSMFWKRKIFETTGLLKKDYHAAMDKELLIRIFINNFKFGHVGKILSGFRMHEGSKSSAGDNNKDMHRDKLVLYELYGKEYGQMKPELHYRLIYGIEKLIRCIYFKKWIFEIRWIGKKVTELNSNNCIYLR